MNIGHWVFVDEHFSQAPLRSVYKELMKTFCIKLRHLLSSDVFLYFKSAVSDLDLSRVGQSKSLKSFVVLLAASATVANAQNLEIVTPAKSNKYTLEVLKRQLPAQKIEVDDPVYKAKKVFEGFLLRDVLKLAGMAADAAADEIVFTAKDGYSPNMTFDKLKKYDAYLVFREAGKKSFDLVEQGRSKISPGPFYVVWKKNKGSDHVPWPYQLVKIEAVNFKTKYPKVFPQNVDDDSSERRGFLIFKAECIRCHSINLQGGDLGPELNAPKNITEYWRADVLEAFIKDATSFRYKSKMPPFKSLTSEQLRDLMNYLKHMAKHKLHP